MNYKEIIKETQGSLAKLSQQLNDIEIEIADTFEINSSNFNDVLNNHEKYIFKFPLIYTIEITDSSILRDLVEKYQNRPQGLKTSKFNYMNKEVPVQNMLYVGSSMKNFYTRIKQHLGLAGKSVYSMHLLRWDKQMTYTVKVTVYEIKNIKNHEVIIPQNVVEAIEQQIWDKLHPIFGKKSGQL